MRPKIILKYIMILLFTFFHKNSYAQLKSFASTTKHWPLAYNKYVAYGYYDFSREIGMGFQNQLGPSWSLDIAAFYVRPNSRIKRYILEWDYYDFEGVGISIKPQYHVGTKGFYFGMTYSFEYLEHKKVSVEIYNGKGYNKYYEENECYGWGITAGFTIGKKVLIGRVRLDPFASLGVTAASYKQITYSSTSTYGNDAQRQYPYVQNTGRTYPNFSLGLKLGIEFKKNKRNAAISLKFDRDYIPRYRNLLDYMKTVEYRHLRKSKSLRKANKKIKAANRCFVKLYRYNYRDTTIMFQKIENYYHQIDSLIQEGKK